MPDLEMDTLRRNHKPFRGGARPQMSLLKIPLQAKPGVDRGAEGYKQEPADQARKGVLLFSHLLRQQSR